MLGDISDIETVLPAARVEIWQSWRYSCTWAGGESVAAALVTKLRENTVIACQLCYRLSRLCERKKRAKEALAYTGLVLS